ncbi:MAG: hypothetical protein DI536_14150 [Archangium gephyra]|uniref:Uncharacterized protein n=1 Tax=Archangium gephyra TaxID=48 RepID=A0A2W5VA15_9BACT|nr:MAG: hypothetical protein DI536_14150 [Archangium gephyra]
MLIDAGRVYRKLLIPSSRHSLLSSFVFEDLQQLCGSFLRTVERAKHSAKRRLRRSQFVPILDRYGDTSRLENADGVINR